MLPGLRVGDDVRTSGKLRRTNLRELVILATWYDLTVVEFADLFDVSAATARVRLHRARARFSAIIEQLHTTAELS